jgi:hypothetical protein
VGPPLLERSKVVTQTERDTLVLQVGGLKLEAHNLTSIQKKIILLTSVIMDAGWIMVVG